VRNPANRKKLERVFVLGAGASYAASEVTSRTTSSATYQAPLDKDFCRRLAEVSLARPGWVTNARDRVVDAWKHTTPFPEFVGLERAILLQLGNREFLEAIHRRRLRGSGDLASHEWMNLVSHLICAILRRCRENGTRLYSKFVDWAFPEESVDSRIITFNYDLLLDKALLKKGFAPEDLYFDAIRQRRDRSSRRNQPHPFLLKLHGSANWRCTSESFKRIIEGPGSDDGGEPFVIPEVWLRNADLASPDDDVSPLIIPPLPTKPITQIKLFRYLWTRAYEYLYEAKELVVVGYSLPDADQMAYSMFSNFKPQRLKNVVVVDPDTSILAKWRDVLRSQGSVSLTYHETFRDYLRSVGAL
jgi:hypothetical protein